MKKILLAVAIAWALCATVVVEGQGSRTSRAGGMSQDAADARYCQTSGCTYTGDIEVDQVYGDEFWFDLDTGDAYLGRVEIREPVPALRTSVLTEATADTFVEINASTGLGNYAQRAGIIHYSVLAEVDVGGPSSRAQALTGLVPFSIGNAGGVMACALGTPLEIPANAGGGTLTNAFSCTTSSGVASLKANASSSNAQTGLRITYRIEWLQGGEASATHIP